MQTAVRNDAKTLLKNTRAKAPKNAKPIALGAGLVLVSVVTLGLSAGNNDAASEIPVVDIVSATPTVAVAELYDFRALNDQILTQNSTLALTLKSGQSLGPLLQKNGVEPGTAYAATEAFSKAYDPRNLRVGQKINLYFSTGERKNFNGLSLKPNAENTVFVERGLDGNFTSKKIAAEFEKTLVKVEAGIDNSLYLDAQALGAPDKVIAQFAQIYAHSVDFQRDIRKGDKFEMMFELYRDHKGNTVKAGDLVFTSFSPRGKTSEYFLFEKSNGREGYYDKKGNGAKRMLMRTPVNGARLSSRFGSRKHPILGYRKNHTGVDFAAPRGTPIMAAGTGTILRANRFGSFGNYVSIRHSDGYVTAYAHMSKFARGARKGRRVIQGQTIGYVGTTGRSTGPHLHYEVHKRGRKINPMTLSTRSGKPLKKSELPAFKTRAKEILALKSSAGSALTVEALLVVENANTVTDATTTGNSMPGVQ
ncbi:M23 family metallopeptidase [bacterium AH-315-J19]|nr:M23 family metallopeptidase [bacterium AH-315-J19]